MLRVDPGELDLHAVEALVREGQAALQQDDHGQAATLLRAADSLWRGRPLADLESVAAVAASGVRSAQVLVSPRAGAGSFPSRPWSPAATDRIWVR